MEVYEPDHATSVIAKITIHQVISAGYKLAQELDRERLSESQAQWFEKIAQTIRERLKE